MRRFFILLAILFLASSRHAAGEPAAPLPTVRAGFFPLGDVRLLDSRFKQAQDLDRNYLLTLEPDRLLSHMRRAAGLEPKGKPYGGWDRGGSGMIGHYLSACAEMAAATGDPRLRQRVDYIVTEMTACQDARGDGLLHASGYDAGWFKDLKAGRLRPQRVLPWYVMHKPFAGLRDAWYLCGSEPAKKALIRLADACLDYTAKLTDDQWRAMMEPAPDARDREREVGGPNEILADVYALTGNAKYLDAAKKFCKLGFRDALARGDDSILYGKHANTQIPLFVGYERIFEVSGEPVWHSAAQNFWDKVRANQTFVMGGNSIWETFINPFEFDKKLNDICGPETCNTYNLLKLTQQLYSLDPQVRYMDYVERALYNQILPSEGPAPQGGFAYYTPTRPGHYKRYSQPFDAFWCCVGTGMENQARYGKFIYANAPHRLYVNLLIPSTLDWKAEGVTVQQTTTFPAQPVTTLAFALPKPKQFTVSLRYPDWAAAGGGLRLAVNGQGVAVTAKPGSYADVTRVWQNGDRLQAAYPSRVSVEFTPGNASYASFFYGPILLAAPLGAAGLETKDFYADGAVDFAQLGRKSMDPANAPAVTGARDRLAPGVQRAAGTDLAFKMTGNLSRPADLPLVPFYDIGLQRYSIYFPAEAPPAAAPDPGNLGMPAIMGPMKPAR